MSECPAYNGIFEYASIRELAHFSVKINWSVTVDVVL